MVYLQEQVASEIALRTLERLNPYKDVAIWLFVSSYTLHKNFMKLDRTEEK